MLTLRRRGAALPAPPAGPDPGPDARHALGVVAAFAQQASALGREAAEVRGVLDDTHRIAGAQGTAVQALAQQLQQVVAAQHGIADETGRGLQAVGDVAAAVQGVSTEVGGIVETLRQVADAAGQITQIALQTRLVAFNASVEAKRAGEAGRGFGVVADAVKALAGQVESSSKQIMGTVERLDGRIAALAREIGHAPGRGSAGSDPPGAVHRALDAVAAGVQRIHQASQASREVCGGLTAQITAIDAEMGRTTTALDSALARTEALLRISEQLIEHVADCGVETEDTPYIRAAQQAAGRIAALLDEALRSGAIGSADLFDEHYQPVPGSAPAQHLSRHASLAERLFPPVQEEMLGLSDKVVYCIAVDRNGYVACHNRQYNHPQRPGDVVWNTAHCRNRRIFNDRTGLASARNQRPFLLQTYRRDMGGGQFVVMKEAAAPITVAGRHWGGLRLAFKF
ncbi:MAG: chemotaxis protein [Burkholderiales bacterium]|nr:chemotaxis protein [Burkholderiales bacterium]